MFRVDASEQMGSGHVMRCVTLAKQLLAICPHAQITFICRDLKGNLISHLHQQNIRVKTLKQQTIPTSKCEWDWHRENWQQDYIETISIMKNQCIAWLIVDHYGLDANWETKMRKRVQHLMVIDDLANRKHDCDLLLDQNIQRHPKRYQKLVPDNCSLLLGPDYLLLREEFMELTDSIQIRSGKINNILVFYGGSDPKHLTLRTLSVLQELSWLKSKVHVVVGMANPQKARIQRKCLERDDYFFYCQIDNMAQLMNRADVIIGAGGSTTWERLYVGLPALTAVTADNQIELTKNMEIEGMTINLGSNLCIFDITLKRAVEKLHRNPILIKKMSERAVRFLDKERIRTYPVRAAMMEVLK